MSDSSSPKIFYATPTSGIRNICSNCSKAISYSAILGVHSHSDTGNRHCKPYEVRKKMTDNKHKIDSLRGTVERSITNLSSAKVRLAEMAVMYDRKQKEAEIAKKSMVAQEEAVQRQQEIYNEAFAALAEAEGYYNADAPVTTSEVTSANQST